MGVSIMAIDEIFKRPTVKKIIFQIRFPNLFYIEDKIGDFQTKIMDEFPESDISYRKRLFLVDKGKKIDSKELEDLSEKEYARKIWEFKSPKDVTLNIMSDSIDISSSHHITYNLGTGDKFRDVIKLVIDNFIEIITIPIINRIGLRYVDDCPIPSLKHTEFKKWYNTCFPLNEFTMKESEEFFFATIIKKDECYLRYIEALNNKKDEKKYTLDFDGYALNIKRDKYLDVTDKLHSIISKQYENVIKKPVKEYMRKEREI